MRWHRLILTVGLSIGYDELGLVAEVTSLNVRPPRSPKGRIPHARLFAKRLRVLRNDAHIAHLLKQNLELKALVRALAEKYLEGKSRREVRQLLQDVLFEQRRIYNEALSRQAIKEARSVDELLLMLDEIRNYANDSVPGKDTPHRGGARSRGEANRDDTRPRDNSWDSWDRDDGPDDVRGDSSTA